MWGHTARQMRNSITRLVAAGLAIVIGTAFIAATMLSSEVVEATSRSAAGAELDGAGIVVQAAGSPLSEEVARRVETVPGIGRVHVQYTLPSLLDAAGGQRYVDLRNPGPGVVLSAGTAPSGASVVISEQLADRLGAQLGDAVTLRAFGTEGPGVTVLISGLVDVPMRPSAEIVYGSRDLVMARQAAAHWPAPINSFLIYPEADPRDLIAQIERVVDDNGVLVWTAEQAVDQRVAGIVGASNALMWLGLGFAALAIIVAGLVIANTFEVLVAQRTRTLAMLRCVGAGKGQVRSTVLLEALILGVAASVLGALFGLGFGQLVVWFLDTRNLGVTVPRLTDLSPWTLIVPVLVGVLVTVVAATGPARLATRVSPIAALRPVEARPSAGAGRVRRVIGALLILGGAALLVTSVVVSLRLAPDNADASAAMGLLLLVGMLGGLLSLVGVLVGAVFIVPRVAGLLSVVLARLVGRRAAVTVRLATANAVRNPRRTATTASALVIGVTLVVLMGTGAASARASMDEMLGQQYPADVVVEGFDGAVVTEPVRRQVEDVAGVVRVLPVTSNQAFLRDPAGNDEMAHGQVFALDPARAAGVVHGADGWPGLAPGEAIVPDWIARTHDFSTGRTLELVGNESGRVAEVTIRVVQGAPMIVVLPETIAPLVDPGDNGLLIQVHDSADLEGIIDDISGVMQTDPQHSFSVSSPALERQSYERVIDALLAVVLGLLAVSVVIALVGVANTLSLSVIERRREHAVLRAVGVTRGQLRGALAVEGVLLALTGAVIGVVLGVVYGWAGAAVLLGFTGGFTMAMSPWIMIGALGIAVLAGLIASVAPANSAIRVPPVVALAEE